MTGGVLSAAFSGAVFKRLSAVETDITRSNQHEFNGSKPLIGLFGKEHPQKLPTDFIRMSDDGSVLAETGMLTGTMLGLGIPRDPSTGCTTTTIW
ncbi:hypothetical protein HED63_26440 [Ochrobactrum cytisi]|nr:hypothetical protein [Brucella cytisi]